MGWLAKRSIGNYAILKIYGSGGVLNLLKRVINRVFCFAYYDAYFM